MIALFDLVGGNVVPTIHCHTLRFLKRIMDKFPDDYMNIYAYLFYMTCPNPDLNPYFHYNSVEKEESIIAEVGGKFSTEEDDIFFALQQCERMYTTETSRAYNGIKKVLENLATYMEITAITDGKDGNITQIVNAAKSFDGIRQSYKGTFKDLVEEQQASVRGGVNKAYDQ